MASPPTGTVTFLFTDIEGSTRFWERSPQAMQKTLARHDELLKSAIEVHGGYIFKTVGDAFCAAFGSATDATEAALTAQRALLEEGWAEEIGAIRVRMALHAGGSRGAREGRREAAGVFPRTYRVNDRIELEAGLPWNNR